LEECNKEKKSLQDKNKKLEDEINKLKEELKKCKENQPKEDLVKENKELKEQLEKCEQEKMPLEEANNELQKALKKCDKYYTALDKKANVILDNFIVQYESTSDLETKIDKIGTVKTLKDENETLKNENKNLQNIDEKCKKLTEENEKLVKENKEITEKNDELVLTVHKNLLNRYRQLNKGITESLENLDKKFDNYKLKKENEQIETENNQILKDSQYENLLKTNQELQKENEEQIVKEIDLERNQYEEKQKIFDILNEKIDIILANFNFEILFPLNDTLEKMEKINLEYDYNSLERTLNNILEQIEKEKEINIETQKRVEILNQKANIVIQMNFSSEKIKEIQKLINKIRNENKLLSKEKEECEKKDFNNQQIINENNHLKEQDFENKIQEKVQEIGGVKRTLSAFIKHNSFELHKNFINNALNNFKIIYNETDSLEEKMDLIIEFSKNIQQ
ncbi:5846_t:CDS:2, partial [Racocetra fulgida]